MDEFEFSLNSPITEEQYDMITDCDFEKTKRIWFKTKHGLTVEFVKAKKPLTNGDRVREMTDEELIAFMFDTNCVNMDWKCKPSCRDCWLDWLKSAAEEGGT